MLLIVKLFFFYVFICLCMCVYNINIKRNVYILRDAYSCMIQEALGNDDTINRLFGSEFFMRFIKNEEITLYNNNELTIDRLTYFKYMKFLKDFSGMLMNFVCIPTRFRVNNESTRIYDS